MEKVIKYAPGPLLLLAGSLWIWNGGILAGALFLLSGLLFCWSGYNYYKKGRKDGSNS